jgi:DNA polymerase III subunit epsilon
MARMLDLTESVTYIECSTELEASVREFRIIQEQKPMFNRSGIRSESTLWLRLTKEAFPRLSVVRQVRPDLGSLHLGPLRSREKATLIVDAITSVIPIRTCTPKLSTKKPTSACALAEIGRCSAPCELLITPDDYQIFVERLNASAAGNDEVQPWIDSKIQELARAEKFEEAAVWRDRLGAWISAVSRSQRLTALVEIRELVAAAPRESGGWDIHVIRHGALAASTHVKDVDRVIDQANSLRLSAQVFDAPSAPAPANTIVEANLILKWLGSENVRLIESTEPWKSPWPSQQSQYAVLEEINNGRAAAHEVTQVRRPVAYNPPK